MKYALVTSSTKGIGKSIAIELLKRGYYVFLNGRNNIEIEDIKCFNDMYSIIEADLSDIENIDILVNHIKSKTNYLDHVILNTGITCYKNFKDIEYTDWNKVLQTNLTIPFFILQNLSDMICDNGRIIFIGTILGLIPHSTSISYSVSKSGLTMLSRSLVKVFKNRNITVNTISPGFIDTNWHDGKNIDIINNIKSKIALCRFGKSEEVASTCMHIIDNQYINGEVIRIDGGYDFE